MSNLVDVRNLNVRFGGERTVYAVNDLSLSLGEGEVLGLLGESGSGKSVTLRALMRLLPKKRTQITGTVNVLGKDVLALDDDELSAFRGQTRVDDLPGAGAGAGSGLHDRPADRRKRDAARGQEPGRGHRSARWRCSKWCAFRRPSAASMPIRTKCPAACGSAR